MKNLTKSRRAFLISNSSVGNAAAAKGSPVRNVSFLVAIVLRISRSNRKSLLCKVGTANSRNTCVDMRASRADLSAELRLLCYPSGSLGISPTPLRLHVFLLRACIQACQFYSPLVQLRCLRHTMQQVFLRECGSRTSEQISVRTDFSLACTFATVQESDKNGRGSQICSIPYWNILTL